MSPVRECLLNMTGILVLLMSQQHGDLNKTCIMTTAVDKPVWVGEISQVSPRDEEL